jgi:hypothetical protein
VHFEVVRAKHIYNIAVPNMVDPIVSPGVQIPLDDCVDLKVYISDTSFEVTEPVSFTCVRLPPG